MGREKRPQPHLSPPRSMSQVNGLHWESQEGSCTQINSLFLKQKAILCSPAWFSRPWARPLLLAPEFAVKYWFYGSLWTRWVKYKRKKEKQRALQCSRAVHLPWPSYRSRYPGCTGTVALSKGKMSPSVFQHGFSLMGSCFHHIFIGSR